MESIILIKGGGDLATGVAHRLVQSGFAVVITEIPQPTVIRRTISFAQAVYTQKAQVEGVTACQATLADAFQVLRQGVIPVLCDSYADCISVLRPRAVIDAIIAKHNTGVGINDAAVVIGLGPGFTAGVDVHAVVETARGHNLGRVYYHGMAEANTGIPGNIGGYSVERLVRAPSGGQLFACRTIGDEVNAGETVALVNGIPAVAAINGILRGLLQDGLPVYQGMKIGDIDPRCRREHCFTISDKARSVGGGVLEALLHLGAKWWQ